jgi:hypothetical protein
LRSRTIESMTLTGNDMISKHLQNEWREEYSSGS